MCGCSAAWGHSAADNHASLRIRPPAFLLTCRNHVRCRLGLPRQDSSGLASIPVRLSEELGRWLSTPRSAEMRGWAPGSWLPGHHAPVRVVAGDHTTRLHIPEAPRMAAEVLIEVVAIKTRPETSGYVCTPFLQLF